MNGRYRYFLCALSPHICTVPPTFNIQPHHGTLITTDEPNTDTLEPPRIHRLGFTFGVVHAMGLDMYLWWHILWFPGGTVVKNPSASAGDARDVSLIPGSGGSPGGGNGNSLQYSCLGNSMDRGALGDNSPWGHKESDTTERLSTAMMTCIHHYRIIQNIFLFVFVISR